MDKEIKELMKEERMVKVDRNYAGRREKLESIRHKISMKISANRSRQMGENL